MTQRLARQMDDPSRRSFMAYAARSALGVAVAPYLLTPIARAAAATPAPASAAASAKRCIYIYLAGGMSHIDTFDPKPGSGVQGPLDKPIKTSADGVVISQLLPLTAKHMHRATIVRSLTSTQGAHERGQYFMRTSYTPIATTQHPAMGPWATRLAGRINPNLPGNVIIGGGGQHPGGGFLDAPFAPLFVGDPANGLPQAQRSRGVTDEQFDRRMAIARRFDAEFHQKYEHASVRAYDDFYNEAIRLMSSDDLKAFDLGDEPAKLAETYGPDRFGKGLMLARRLVEHGVRFVEVTDGGWDTHQDNFDRLEEKLAVLDAGLAALLGDLASRGMLDSTLVVVATEFGRTPQINGADGRDHHPKCFSGLLAGGGVKGGYVHGASDAKGHSPKDDAVTIPDFNATIASALGLPIDQKIVSRDGRPFTIANKGEPVRALLA